MLLEFRINIYLKIVTPESKKSEIYSTSKYCTLLSVILVNTFWIYSVYTSIKYKKKHFYYKNSSIKMVYLNDPNTQS